MRSFTARSKLGDELEAVHVVAALDVLSALFDGLKQPGSFLRLEIVVLDGDELDLCTLRQLGWLVEHEPPVFDVCLECPHAPPIIVLLAGVGCPARSPSVPASSLTPPPRYRRTRCSRCAWRVWRRCSRSRSTTTSG